MAPSEIRLDLRGGPWLRRTGLCCRLPPTGA